MGGGRRHRQGSGAQPRALPGQPIILLVCCAVAALAAVLALGGWGWEGDAAPDPAVAALVQRAHAADRAGRKAEALGLWRQVLRISPTDLDANQALGFYMVYREKLEEAMPFLRQALAHRPQDYTLNHYAGTSQKLRADQLPDTQATLKRELWSEAASHCETARRSVSQRTASQMGSFSDRFLYTHCCEALQSLQMPSDTAACFREAMDAGVWRTEGQRPVNYDPALRARPWWEVAELGRSAVHARVLRSNWERIRDEAARLLRAGREHAGGSASGSEAASAAGFAHERQGLHSTTSWQEYWLWANGRQDKGNCEDAPFTCGLLASMPEATRTTVGDCKLSLMQPGTVVRPHTGPSNQRVRVHLGLDVPAGCCQITVAGESRQWADGELLSFDDSFEHSVTHTGEAGGARLVLIVDFLHPDLEGKRGEHYHGQEPP